MHAHRSGAFCAAKIDLVGTRPSAIAAQNQLQDAIQAAVLQTPVCQCSGVDWLVEVP